MQNRDSTPLCSPVALADVTLDDYDETVRRAVALAFAPAEPDVRDLAATIVRLIHEAQQLVRILIAAGGTPARLPQV